MSACDPKTCIAVNGKRRLKVTSVAWSKLKATFRHLNRFVLTFCFSFQKKRGFKRFLYLCFASCFLGSFVGFWGWKKWTGQKRWKTYSIYKTKKKVVWSNVPLVYLEKDVCFLSFFFYNDYIFLENNLIFFFLNHHTQKLY